jgi:N-methylhydantoinase A
MDARGNVVTPLEDAEIEKLVRAVQQRHLKHAAVCFLFSFINPEHERRLGMALEAAGITVSLSCDVLPEFREYERASTTAINASLRPTVRDYLQKLQTGIDHHCKAGDGIAGTSADPAIPSPALHGLRIMHSGGGTLSVTDAAKFAAKLVLSGPAGGVIGAAFAARAAGFADVITYDMGGTSTDVALVLSGEPQWSTSGVVDGLPIGLPAFDIHTVGAGGGSIARLDAGGALRVGPTSAAAMPGPACYARGSTQPTVTDANLLLGRILPDQFLGGGMTIEPSLAAAAIEPLARAMNRSAIDAALGIVRVAEANMASAIRAVTSQRGHDPRNFALVSFGGAGGLHACALAEALEIPRVVIPPYCGVLSALGMVVARPLAEASRTVVQHAAQLDNARLHAEFDSLDAMTQSQLPDEATEQLQRFADVRFRGQSYEVKVPVDSPIAMASIDDAFNSAYAKLYGALPSGRQIEIVTLRVRRVGRGVEVTLPKLTTESAAPARALMLVAADGRQVQAMAFTRAELLAQPHADGPLLLIDPTATVFVPAGWRVMAQEDGTIICARS